MKRLFASADAFIRESGWRDLALIKFCLFSLGLLAGLRVTQRCKRGVRIAAFTGFFLTYVPLMAKYLRILTGKSAKT